MISALYIWRSALVAAVMISSMLGLGSRLAFLHLGENGHLQDRVERMRVDEQEILVGRGRIFDTRGTLLAIDLPMKDVIVDPVAIQEAGHVQFVSAHLSRLLKKDPDEVLAKICKPDRRWEKIEKFVPMEVVEQIEHLQLPGVFYEDVCRRHYPHGHLMSHVIGFANYAGVGSAGVEQSMNRFLKGRPGLVVTERDGKRRNLYNRRSLEIPPQAGADVHLTIDEGLQFMVEQALDEAMEEHHAKGAWALVQRVRTGEMLAMAGRPGYDLNLFTESTPEQRRNRSISYVYEPGSTFKVAIIAAALNEGVVSPTTMFNCEHGCWYYRGRPLRDYHGYGMLSMADVLKKSSNIGAAKIALMLNPARTERYLREFGIGASVGLSLPGEEGGIFRSRDSWTAISLSRIAMGHEVAVTSLQMLNAVSAIANDGFLMKPRIIRKVVHTDGRTLFETEPEVLSRPITPETSATMRRLMARVTEQGGTGRRARLEDLVGFTVAGKTGTAQKPVRGGYSDTANMASFVGFLPAEKPEISMIVVVDEPQPKHTGGAVAAPVFRKIAEQAVKYLDIPPVLKPGEETAGRGRRHPVRG